MSANINQNNKDDDANMFKESASDPVGLKEKLLGPDYPYYKYVKPPDKIGMSSAGSLSQLGKNINGLMSYTELLVEGTGKASATGKPLGNKFFLKTGAKCKPVTNKNADSEEGETADAESEDKEDRYMYINNVPQGNIPFISSGMGTNFKEMRGLIPGTLSDLNAFNPMTIMSGFMEGSSPECDEITMETIDTYNNRSTESHYVTLTDISNMDPCSFLDKKNPQTGQKCKEAFTSRKASQLNPAPFVSNQSNNPLGIQLYYGIVGVLGIYVVSQLCKK
jgi:hypothetical protein